MKIFIGTFLIILVECKPFLKFPIFTTIKNKELPDYDNGTLDYAYMTKDRNNLINKNKVEEEKQNKENEEINAVEEQAKTVGNNSQSGTFGPNSGNMSNNTNSNNTTTNNTNNYQTPEKGLKDTVPLGAMQNPSTTNVNSKTDASHHKGDSSTFVTNNFYNPSNKTNESDLTVGGQLEYEYLWKRIYDIDNKLAELTPIIKNDQKNPLKRKGLIITFDPESNPNNKTLSVESDGIPNDL